MRVLILTEYYQPEPIPKPSEVADGLRRRGHQVEVLTGLPNYPKGVLYPGYGLRPWLRERVRDVPVLRVFQVPYHGLSAFGRMLNYGSFMVAAILGGLLVEKPDVMYVFYPPLTVGVAARVIGGLRRVPFVLDVQDIWPDAVVSSGLLREGLLTRLMGRLERWLYGGARRILTVTDGALRNLSTKGVPGEKLVTLPNWIMGDAAEPPSSESVQRARAELDADDDFIVTFAGNLGALQDLDTVLEAAELLQREGRRIAVRIIGDGSERKRLEQLAKSKELENLRFLGPYPSARMSAFFAASGALIVHLNAGKLTDLILPTKTLAYMAAGRPIIAATSGATAELIDRARAGLTAPGGDSQALAKAMLEMSDLPNDERQAMGDRGRVMALTEFDREMLIDRLAVVLETAATAK
jgi:glycosyltransferase involved in cell wall biosynthesis